MSSMSKPNSIPKINQVSPLPEPAVSSPTDPTSTITPNISPHKYRLSWPSDAAESLIQFQRHSTRSAHMRDEEYRQKLEFRKTSGNRISYLTTVRPKHSHHISGWTSKGYYASRIKDCPPGMDPVIGLGSFFVSSAGETFGTVFDSDINLGTAKYQVFSSDGQVQFYAVETLQEYDSYPFRIRGIEFVATGAQGGVVFRISGTNKVAQINNDNKPLGTIRRLRWARVNLSDKHWSYSVFDAGGQEVWRFERHRSGDKYDLFYLKAKVPFGVANDDWDTSKYTVPEDTDLFNIFGVDLGSDGVQVNPEHKTLIIAATLVIYDKYSREEDLGPNKKRFKIGLIFNLCVTLITLILIAAVILSTIEGRVLNSTPCLLPP